MSNINHDRNKSSTLGVYPQGAFSVSTKKQRVHSDCQVGFPDYDGYGDRLSFIDWLRIDLLCWGKPCLG